MKRVLKFASGAVLTVVGLVLVLLLTHMFWLGAVVRSVANGKVPELTGTAFNLDTFSCNAFSGRLHAGGMTLYNPSGFKEPRAFGLDGFDIDLDVPSVLSDTVVVRRILLDGVFVSWVELDGTNNFERIGANVSRATSDGKKDGPSDTQAKAPESPAGEPASSGGSGSGKKVVIDELTLRNMKVRWMGMTIPVPTIVVRGIGRAAGGVTWSVAGEEILSAVLRQLQSLSGGLLNFGTLLKDTGMLAVSNSVREVSGALSAGAGEVAAATETSAKAVTEALNDGAGEIAGTATNAVNLLFKALKDGVDAVGAGSKGAVESTGDALKDGRDALRKSGDALKDLLRRRK